MKNNISIFILSFVTLFSYSQSYEFETVIDLEATDVISQGNTGTCWSFSTSSFIESEIMRLTGEKIDISEMYNVRQTYPKKAWNYLMRQGKAQFGEGGLAHDVMNSIRNYGLVPNIVYSGLKTEEENHNHAILVDSLAIILNRYIDNPKDYTTNWSQDVNLILDSYLGKDISSFSYEGNDYTPMSFLKMTKINPEDYITITSFSHVPYYSNFILNIPDNFSNGTFFNVKLDDLANIANSALQNGYSIELDCDVSEKSFSSKNGLAIIPKDENNIEDALKVVKPEKEITQEYRQQEFENFNTTDDHLMHITGMLKDQNGVIYYKVKNSWGKNSERVGNSGYIYMSEAYFKMKTISIMLHKEAIDKKYLKFLSK